MATMEEVQLAAPELTGATLEVYVQHLLDSFHINSGEIMKSRVTFVEVLLRMHAWFATSTELFSLLTRDVLPNSSQLTKSTQHITHDEMTINNNHYCTCSNRDLRRRNNRVLSSLAFDDLDVATTSFSLTKGSSSSKLLEIDDSDTMNGGVTNHCMDVTERTTPNEDNKWIPCRRACHVLRYWMQMFPVHFEGGSELYTAMSAFKDSLEQINSSLYDVISSGDVRSYDWMRKVTAKASSLQRSDSHNKISLVFNNLSVEELARHLSYIDYKACRRITFTEYKTYAKTGKMAGCPRLERSVCILNGLTQWVQLMVLSKTHPRQRAAIISKFVRVAQHLISLRCYNTCMAVVGGITHSSLARLHKTNNHLSAETLKLLDEHTDLISSKNNYQAYRKCFSRIPEDKYSLPIVGIHLKDLVALHTSLPDRVGDHPSLINFHKMSQLSSVMSCLTKLQDQVPDYSINTDLIDTLKLALDVFYTEEEIFELSLAREPRASTAASTTASKELPKLSDQQHILSEWQTGLKPPDKDTINKHVSNMVAAMFNNYDHDKDGYISVEEFETISSNFPFIESSFCILDVSDNGLLSEGEVKKYFTMAKCSSLKKSFKHNFTETTYFKLTYCNHCSGLLWGLIKQGWRCKDCGLNAHKSCKDRVVMDCRSKATPNSLSSKAQSIVITRSPSSSSLSTSTSPQTPSTPDFTHQETRFNFSRLSAKNSPSEARPAYPRTTTLPNVESLGCKYNVPSACAENPGYIASDLTIHSADPDILSLKLMEYQHLVSSKDRVLEVEMREKKELQEQCTNHMQEINSLRQQLALFKSSTLVDTKPSLDCVPLPTAPV